MGQAELCFQVQEDLVLLVLHPGACTWCPPGIWMQERVVGHVSRWVRTEVGSNWRVGAKAVVEGAVPTAAWEGEEGPATRQVSYGWATGLVHTSGNWQKEWWRVRALPHEITYLCNVMLYSHSCPQYSWKILKHGNPPSKLISWIVFFSVVDMNIECACDTASRNVHLI